MTTRVQVQAEPFQSADDQQQEQPKHAPRAKRRKVEHLFWQGDGWFCRETGTPLPYLCGRWGAAPSEIRPARETRTPDRDVVIATEKADCKTCLKVLRAYWYRRGAKTVRLI